MSQSMLITQTDTSLDKCTGPYQEIAGEYQNIALVVTGISIILIREVEHIGMYIRMYHHKCMYVATYTFEIHHIFYFLVLETICPYQPQNFHPTKIVLV